MSQITVRGIPSETEAELKRLSSSASTSLNKTVLGILKRATGKEVYRQTRKRDLSSVTGRWTLKEAENFDRSLEQFESVDEELWR